VDYAFKIPPNPQHYLPGEPISFGRRFHHLTRVGTWNKLTSHHRLRFGGRNARREDSGVIEDKCRHAVELERATVHAALRDSVSWPCRVDEDAEQLTSVEFRVQRTIGECWFAGLAPTASRRLRNPQWLGDQSVVHLRDWCPRHWISWTSSALCDLRQHLRLPLRIFSSPLLLLWSSVFSSDVEALEFPKFPILIHKPIMR
jgi:hypothetical protein